MNESIKVIRIKHCTECPHCKKTEPDPTACNADGHYHCTVKDTRVFEDVYSIPPWCPLD